MLHTRGDSRGWTSVTPTTTPTVGGSLFRQGRCQEPGTQLANGVIWVHMCGLHPKGVSMRGKPQVVGVLSALLLGHSPPRPNRGALRLPARPQRDGI